MLPERDPTRRDTKLVLEIELSAAWRRLEMTGFLRQIFTWLLLGENGYRFLKLRSLHTKGTSTEKNLGVKFASQISP